MQTNALRCAYGTSNKQQQQQQQETETDQIRRTGT